MSIDRIFIIQKLDVRKETIIIIIICDHDATPNGPDGYA